MGDEAFAKRKQGVQKNELNEQLKDYINQWRDERAKEEAAEAFEGQAGGEEGDPRRAGQAAGSEEEGGGRPEEEGRGREEGRRGGGEEEADGGGRDQEAGEDGRPEGGRKEVVWSGHGRSQRDVQDKGAGGGRDEDFPENPHQAPRPGQHGL